MVNTFAMTLLLVSLGLAGESELAADIGIVQGATLALFYAFSANARSLILNGSSQYSAGGIMLSRIVLVIPLALIAYWLSVKVAGVPYLLASVLILRRITEWLGEVHLSEMEKLGSQSFAQRYLILQSTLLFLVILWVVGDFPHPLLGLLVWAAAPLTLSMRFIGKSFTKLVDSPFQLALKMMPHFGSTAIIGVTVYIFRLLIILLTGKEIAGDLFTAFAIGGLAGSLFANAFGASIALHEQLSGKKYFPQSLRWLLNLSAILGACLYVAASLNLSGLDWTGKSDFFWQAAGLSMIGGVVMVYAQRIRFRLLQGDEERDVFGPDVIINLLLIMAIPIAVVLGIESLVTLYLFSALLCLVFYFSAQHQNRISHILDSNPRRLLFRMSLISVFLVFPIFFQLNSGIFRDTSDLFDSGGMLLNVPIPISVLACFIGILILAQYRNAIQSFVIIFFTFIILIISTLVISTDNDSLQSSKLILLIQFLLPMFGLVLGQMYARGMLDTDKVYIKSFLVVLAVIVPLQLVITITQDKSLLTSSLGLFSVYQHLDYVPMVFAAVYVMLLPMMWSSMVSKLCAIVLGLILTEYISKSLSEVAPWLILTGLMVFAWMRYRLHRDALSSLVLILFFSSYLAFNIASDHLEQYKLGMTSNSEIGYLLEGYRSQSLESQQATKYFADDGYASTKSLLFGSAVTPTRTEFTGNKNYYSDMTYNFGLIGLMPFLILLVHTISLVKSNWDKVCSTIDVTLLVLVVMTLVVVDSFFQVGLRQPYPGLFTFFLWGILIAKLTKIKKKNLCSY